MFRFIKKIEKKVYLFKDLKRSIYVLYDNGDIYDIDDMYIAL